MCVFEELIVAHLPRKPVDPHSPVRSGKVHSSLKNRVGVETKWESYIDFSQRGGEKSFKDNVFSSFSEAGKMFPYIFLMEKKLN